MPDLVGAVLVVGGGVAGIQSALDLADMGFKVYLVERSPSIGGKMAQLDKTFPTNDCSMCILAPKMVECSRHKNIEILSYTDVVGLEGEAGNFTVAIKRKARYISEEKCTGCGICTQKCPVKNKVTDKYDADLRYRRAIYKHFPQAVPNVALIDKDHCLYLTKGKCGTCKKVCPAEAVDYEQEDELKTLKVGSIIIAAGMDIYDPSQLPTFGYDSSPDIVTSMEFERILSASGPFEGHIVRPSDHEDPKKIAFIQCVGSRNRRIGRDFCSGACCMYSIKEAIIAKEHNPNLEITIFYMDIRAFGKEFEEYYLRAQSEYGIKFVNSRVSLVEEDPATKKILLYYEDRQTAQAREEEFDMVVLSVGYQQPPYLQTLSNAFNLELNKFGFIKTTNFTPVDTNVPGIHVCGICAGPKDIPDTVAQASGAAAKCASFLSPARGTLVKTDDGLIPETPINPGDAPRIGVLICRCGTNIAATVDVPEVVEYVKTLPNVIVSEENMYSCSSDTQERIKKLIKENDLNRFMVASCTPRTHEALFANTCREAGMNPYLFELVNIRDQCSWVHMKEPKEATAKAKDLVRMGLGKLRLAQPLEKKTIMLNQELLIVGGGISGITAALEAAKQGFKTYLVEKSDKLGGLLNKIHYLFDNQETQKFLADKVVEINSNPNIEVLLNSQLSGLTGFVGNYHATIITSGNARELEVGAIIVAVGSDVYEPVEYLYGKDERILTGLEIEELLYQKKLEGQSFCFIQCVGSRNDENPYCNRICCTEAMKNAIKIKETISDAEVTILYRDIRVYGFNEQYYTQARELGVNFVKYDAEKPPKLKLVGEKLELKVPNPERPVILHPDKIVLSVGVKPRNNEALSKMLKVPLNSYGFFLEAHMKLRPVDFATDGVFLCGSAHWPKLIPESISQANAAASRAARLLSTGSIETAGTISHVDPEKCIGCGLCTEVCPYNAIQLEQAGDIMKARVIEVSCKSCGLCGATCPVKAISMSNFTDEQLISSLQELYEAA
jgi:heterodisulfide reductase subunit A